MLAQGQEQTVGRILVSVTQVWNWRNSSY